MPRPTNYLIMTVGYKFAISLGKNLLFVAQAGFFLLRSINRQEYLAGLNLY